DQGMGWYFSAMPRKPPKPTTANMMLLDCLSSITSSISPILLPVVSLTFVPMTFLARMALVCPLAGVMSIASTVIQRTNSSEHEFSRKGGCPHITQGHMTVWDGPTKAASLTPRARQARTFCATMSRAVEGATKGVPDARRQVKEGPWLRNQKPRARRCGYAPR